MPTRKPKDHYFIKRPKDVYLIKRLREAANDYRITDYKTACNAAADRLEQLLKVKT